MNIMIAAVGVNPGFAVGGGSAEEALAVAGFALIGLVLLFAAGRLCGRVRGHADCVRYAASQR